MRAVSALVVVVTIATLTTSPAVAGGSSPSTTAAAADCLSRPTVIGATSSAETFPGDSSVPDGSAIDARDTVWASEHDYPVLVRGHESEQRRALCLVGGRISNSLPHDTTDWDTWHGTAGVTVRRDNFQLIGTELDNVGDGVRFAGPDADNWTVRGVRVHRAHDDCLENDMMQSGTIDDSFFDGCYVFYSARGAPRAGADGGANTVTITNSLVRLEAMPSLYDGRPGPGHGGFFKLSSNPSTGRSPRLVIHDTVFRVDQPASHGELTVPTYDDDRSPDTPALPYLDPADCSGNTVVWLGEGPFPAELPPCFELSTDPRVWDRAVLDWETPPELARAASDRLVETLVRATCGRIGQPGGD